MARKSTTLNWNEGTINEWVDDGDEKGHDMAQSCFYSNSFKTADGGAGATPDYEGAMLKRGDDMMKRWKERYFQLLGSRLRYLDKKDGKKNGDILIPGAVVTQYHPELHGKGINHVISISPASSDRKYLLQCPDSETRTAWCSMLENAGADVILWYAGGMMEKTGADGLKGAYKKRFFILTSEGLTYYKDETSVSESSALGTIPLVEGVSDCMIEPNACDGYVMAIYPRGKGTSKTAGDAQSQNHRIYYLRVLHQDAFHWWNKLVAAVCDCAPAILHADMRGKVVVKGHLATHWKGVNYDKWKERYCEIKSGDIGRETVIRMYKNSNDWPKGCAGELKVGGHEGLVMSKNGANTSNHHFLVTFKTDGKLITLATRNEQEQHDWYQCLQRFRDTSKFAFSGKEGFVLKRGALNTAFKQRYLVRLPNLLLYFKSKSDRNEAGLIHLTPDVIACVDDDDPKVTDRFEFSVQVFQPQSRIFVFATRTKADRAAWISAIRDHTTGGGRDSAIPSKSRDEDGDGDGDGDDGRPSVMATINETASSPEASKESKGAEAAKVRDNGSTQIEGMMFAKNLSSNPVFAKRQKELEEERKIMADSTPDTMVINEGLVHARKPKKLAGRSSSRKKMGFNAKTTVSAFASALA